MTRNTTQLPAAAGAGLRHMRQLLGFLFIISQASPLLADSAAANNRKGNRLYEQKQFVEAEKAYLDAQLEAPGRPELLYNHGNTLIQQKKYDQALQSLRQATAKGDKGLQASSWYNMGNGLFEAGKYKDAAESYMQALRINPSDRDAKHNLELAWKKLQESQQQSNNKDKKQKDQDSKQNQSKNDSPSGEDKQKPQDSQGEKSQPQPQQSQSSGKERMSKEQAMQLLDAMKNQEVNEQRKMLERQAKQVKGGKDW